jgi:hypothetical protein
MSEHRQAAPGCKPPAVFWQGTARLGRAWPGEVWHGKGAYGAWFGFNNGGFYVSGEVGEDG